MKANLPQHAFKQAIQFKAVAATTGVNQLVFQRLVVKMHLAWQEYVEILKGNCAVVMDMQTTQRFHRDFRSARPTQTSKIGV